MKETFKDPGYTLYRYADVIYVDCPDGEGPGIIRGEFTWFPKQARLTSCFGSFHREWNATTWLGPVIGHRQRFCPICSADAPDLGISKTTFRSDLPHCIDYHCGRCGGDSEMEITWCRGDIHTPGCDPYFGLPLYLREIVGNETLWFFNADHMNQVRSYVAADLRERLPDGKWSMITRLPTWIKTSKNRSKVLRAIARLEAKLSALNRKLQKT